MPGVLTLRDFKGPVITVQCKPCGRQGELDRKALVKQFGTSMRFVDLRRRMAMGCDKMHCPDGQDRCGTGFPCLLEAAVAVELQEPTLSLELSKLDCDPKGSEASRRPALDRRTAVCNLYNVTTTRDAVLQFTKAFRDRAGWNEASFDVYPGYQAPIVRIAEDGQREVARATWGMPSPPAYVKNYDPGVTNIRNVSSPHWRRWLGPTSRCVVPFTSFAEPDPASKAEGARVPNAWFAGNEDRPLMFFAGFWTPWKGVRKVRDGEQEYELFGFLTTSPNEIVSPIHEKAMPAILTTSEEVDTWLTAPWDEARHLQRPLPATMLVIVPPQPKPILDAEGLLL